MILPPRPPPARARAARWALATAIALLHAGVLTALLTARAPSRSDPVLRQVLTLVAVPAAPREALPPPPPPPEPAIALTVPAPPTVLLASDAPVMEAVRAPAEPCALERAVADALAADANASAALAGLGPGARASTGVVMLWNGAWTRGTDPADAARLDRVRAVAMSAIARTPASCRSAAMTGPRLIAVPGHGRTTLLALGSGQWRWSELLGRATK